MDLQGIWQRSRVLSEDGLRRARRARYKTFNWGTSEEFKVRAANLEERDDPSACWSTSVVFLVEPADLRTSSHADPPSWITIAPIADGVLTPVLQSRYCLAGVGEEPELWLDESSDMPHSQHFSIPLALDISVGKARLVVLLEVVSRTWIEAEGDRGHSRWRLVVDAFDSQELAHLVHMRLTECSSDSEGAALTKLRERFRLDLDIP